MVNSTAFKHQSKTTNGYTGNWEFEVTVWMLIKLPRGKQLPTLTTGCVVLTCSTRVPQYYTGPENPDLGRIIYDHDGAVGRCFLTTRVN